MPQFASSQSIRRIEDAALLSGRGCYTDDIELKDAAHAAIVRSPHAHARIVSVDTARARAAPGVLAVLTGRDAQADGLGNILCMIPVQNVDGTQRADTPRPVLALERVRHAGDPVAMVVAQTLQQARDAAELVEIEYEPLAAVTDTWAAAQEGAPRLWEKAPGNLAFHWRTGDKAAVDEAFKRAARVVTLRLVNNRLVANPMEPRSALADYDAASGRSTLYTPTQGPGLIRDQIVQLLKLEPAQLRCVSRQVGGAFGMKIFLHPEQPLTVWASRRLKRAVRWTAERSEGFLSDVQGRDNVSIAELALDGNARFLALRVTTYANMGAYLSNFGPFIPQLAAPVLSGTYRIPAIALDVKAVLTNTVPVDAYRGAGRPEGIYLVERIVDAAARELGLAPDELRRRNFVKPEEMPYDTKIGSVYDSGDFAGIMQRAMEKADWAGFAARREESARRGSLRGIGLAVYIERCGGGDIGDTVVLKIDAEGTATLYSGMQDNGQGHATIFTQLLAEKLGIDASRIRVVQGDTDLTPSGLTGGSRFLALGGLAAAGAADQAIEKGKDIASHLLEAAAADIEYVKGEFRVAGTDRRVSLGEVARGGGGLEASHTRASKAYTYPNGCHICELEIDRDTGRVEILRHTVVDDFGFTLNPLLAAGQVHGGTAQGIGQALLEHTVYDPDSGQLLSGSFMDYALPRADDLPSLDCEFRDVPCTTNPLGVKGAGEAGAVGAPAAVVNAVVDALKVAHLDMPLTAPRVWRALRAQR
ncbi:MAG: carbon monoxide dehydrogenase [Betaproteobacteria bacterium RIFCSPLOWO2_12_FULL_68_20]|nr:MAG: carbon monoxide dehydrogenase [Betaproteobacteria bacterium RIFCSPLOWO2_12_FULL_68_20]